MKLSNALIGGLAGAITVTALNEITRQILPEAPRLDLLGMRAITASLDKMGRIPPEVDVLRPVALGGDIVANSLYYSLVGLLGGSKLAWAAGIGFGLAAGLGAVFLPARLQLGSAPTGRSRVTQILTVAYYLQAGVISALTARMLTKNAGGSGDLGQMEWMAHTEES